jgi:release factor glutamine methyltransferase
MASIAELLAHHDDLKPSSDTALLDCELLLGHCLNKSRSYLKGFGEVGGDPTVKGQYEILLQRRNQGEPVAYLIGYQGFWTLDLEVAPSTLIPRPETELLVEQVLHYLADKQETTIEVLDLGTGTGAIALALASECTQWAITGTDIRPEAIALAKRNQQRNNLAHNKLQFIQSDWFKALAGGVYDLIVSNPPYIDAEDPHLNQGDVRYEPQTALVADQHGLADLNLIIQQSVNYLSLGGWLMLEHGYNQGEAVRSLLMAAGFKSVVTEKDLSGNDRVSLGCRSSE